MNDDFDEYLTFVETFFRSCINDIKLGPSLVRKQQSASPLEATFMISQLFTQYLANQPGNPEVVRVVASGTRNTQTMIAVISS